MTDFTGTIKALDAQSNGLNASSKLIQDGAEFIPDFSEAPATAQTVMQMPQPAKLAKEWDEMSRIEQGVNAFKGGLHNYRKSGVANEAIDQAVSAEQGLQSVYDVDDEMDPEAAATIQALLTKDTQVNRDFKSRAEVKLQDAIRQYRALEAQDVLYKQPDAVARASEAAEGKSGLSGFAAAAGEFFKGDALGNAIFLAGSSTGAMLPYILASVATGGTMGGLTGVKAIANAARGLTMAYGSYQNEAGQFILDELKRRGINPGDINAQAFRDLVNAEDFEQVQRNRAARATVVSAFDFVSGYATGLRLNPSDAYRTLKNGAQNMAQKMTETAEHAAMRTRGFEVAKTAPKAADVAESGVAKTSAKNFGGHLENMATQSTVQGVLGGAGEYLGSKASGQDPNMADVLFEMLGEFTSAPVEVATGAVSSVTDARRQVLHAQVARDFKEQMAKVTEAAESVSVKIGDQETVTQWANRVGEGRSFSAFAQDLVENKQIEEIRKENPALAQKIEQAAAEKKSVDIPVSTIVSIATKNRKAADDIIMDCRPSVDGLSVRQAEEFAKNGRKQAEKQFDRTLKRFKVPKVVEKESREIGSWIRNRLVEGGFSDDYSSSCAAVWQSYLVQRAKLLGTSPKELARMMNWGIDLGERETTGRTGPMMPSKGVQTAGVDGKLNQPMTQGVEWHMGATRLSPETRIPLRSFENVSAPRAEVRDYLVSLMQNGVKNKDTGFNLVATKADLGKWFSNPRRDWALRVVYKKINEIIADAVRVESHSDTMHENADVRGIHRLVSAIRIGDQNLRVVLTVRDYQPRAGERTSLHSIDNIDFQIEGNNNPAAANPEAAGSGSQTVKMRELASGAPSNRPYLTDTVMLSQVLGGSTPYVRADGRTYFDDEDPAAREQGGAYYEPNSALNQEVSTALPSEAAVRKGLFDDPRFVRHWASMGVASQSPDFLKKVADSFRAIPGLNGVMKGIRKPTKAAEAAVERMTDNLVWLYNQVPEEVRNRSRLWYDGAHKTAEVWAKRYGMRTRQTAAIIAIFSPQTDWFLNMSMAERLLDIYFGARRTVPTPKHEAALKARSETDEVNYEDVKGKTLEQLVQAGKLREAGVWVRTYDEVHHSKRYNVLSPEGGVGGIAKTSTGKSNARFHYMATGTLEKALSVIVDGSVENVFKKIGSQFKVRDFYNNIYNPKNTNAATIDTHAVGADTMSVVSSKSLSVNENFGKIKNSVSGQNGTFPFHFEAYRRAAERMGVSPREMQSITWEAIRALFPEEQKAGLRDKVEAIWKRCDQGEITADQAREEIVKVAGGFRPTAWESVPFNDEITETYDRSKIKLYDDIAQPEPEPALSLEVAPDPNDADAVAKWDQLTSEQKFEVTQEVMPWVLEQVALATQTHISEPHLQRGGYLGTGNYSVVCSIADGGDYVRAGRLLASYLRQDSVMALSAAPGEGMAPSKVIRIQLPEGFTDEQIDDLYVNKLDKIRDKDGRRLIPGHSAVDGVMSIAIDAKDADAVDEALSKVLDGIYWDIDDVNVGFLEAYKNQEETNAEDDTGTGSEISQRTPVGYDIHLQSEVDRRLSEAIEAKIASRQRGFNQEAAYAEGVGEGGSGAFSQDMGSVRGQYNPVNTGDASQSVAGVIRLMQSADRSTFMHESAHAWLDADTKLGLRIAEKVRSGVELTEGEASFLKNLGGFFEWGQREGVINLGVSASAQASVARALEQWTAMPVEAQRGMHELFARGFESYLIEGESPSPEMTTMFHRFRSWLKDIYARAVNALNPLSPEVKKLYDLMFVSEQEAADAETRAGLRAMFDEVDARKLMTEEERHQYEKLYQEASAETQSKIAQSVARVMKMFTNRSDKERRRIIRRYKDRVKAQEEELMMQPRYKAWHILRRGWTAKDGTTWRFKLSEEALKNSGYDEESIAVFRKKRFTTKGPGVSLEQLAQIVGHDSPSELAGQMLEVTSAKDEAADMVAAQLKEETGTDITHYSRLQADLAAHNATRSRLLAAEFNAIARLLGRKQLLVGAAREYAQKRLADTKVSELSPYSFERDERRCADEAEDAWRKGDYERCLEMKRAQIVNHEMARVALEIQDGQVKCIRRLKRALKSKAVHPANRQILAYIAGLHGIVPVPADLRRMTSKKAAIDAATKLLNEGTPIDGLSPDPETGLAQAPLLDNGTRVNDMTVDQARELFSMLQQVEKLGRDRLTIERNGIKEDAREEIKAGVTELAAAAKEQKRKRQLDQRVPTTKREKFVDMLKQAFYAHIKVATWCRIFDRNQDGGFFWNHFIRTANDRASWEESKRAELAQKLQDIFAPIADEKKGIFDQEIIRIGRRMMSKGERIAAALNLGNESNLKRLKDGDPLQWTEETLKALTASLSEEDWRAIQKIWDLFEDLRPLIGEKQKRVYGIEPIWIDYKPFTVMAKGGKEVQLRGGYYPVVYDPRASKRAEQLTEAAAAQQLMKSAFQSSTTSRSFTKQRVDEVAGRPLRLDLSALYSGLNDVIHDLAWHEWLINTQRLLNGVDGDGSGLSQQIKELYGHHVAKAFDEWTQAIAQGDRTSAESFARTALRFMSGNVGLTAMGFSVSSAVSQITGIGYIVPRAGVSATLGAIRDATRGRHALRLLREAINSRSDLMKTRHISANRQINELRNRLDKGKEGFIKKYAYAMMMAVQHLVDTICWMAMFRRCLDDGITEEEAIARADQAVIDTQSSGRINDESAVERSEILGPFTVFYSWANAALNMEYAVAKGEASKSKRLATMIFYALVMPQIDSLLRDCLKAQGDDDDDDDDKTWVDALIRKPFANAAELHFGMFAGAREISSTVKGILAGERVFDYAGPGGTRGITVAGKGIEAVAELSGVAVGDGEVGWKSINALIDVSGLAVGAPSSQIKRTIKGIRAVGSGQAEGFDALKAPIFGYEGQIKD